MDVAGNRSMRYDNYVRMQNLCNVFLMFIMVLWVIVSVMPCKRVVPKLWHASQFLGLRRVGGEGVSSLFLIYTLPIKSVTSEIGPFA
jgi:hypothetical protein